MFTAQPVTEKKMNTMSKPTKSEKQKNYSFSSNGIYNSPNIRINETKYCIQKEDLKKAILSKKGKLQKITIIPLI